MGFKTSHQHIFKYHHSSKYIIVITPQAVMAGPFRTRRGRPTFNMIRPSNPERVIVSLVNALVYRPADEGILVVRPRLKSPPSMPLWILPGGKPEPEISRNYFREYLISKLEQDFPGLHLEPHPDYQLGEIFGRIMHQHSPRDSKILYLDVYAFVTSNGMQPLSPTHFVEDIRWAVLGDGPPLSPFTAEIINYYRKRGMHKYPISSYQTKTFQ